MRFREYSGLVPFLAGAAVLATGLIPAPIAAAVPLLAGVVENGPAADLRSVELLRLNSGATAEVYHFPERLAAAVMIGGEHRSVMLERAAGGEAVQPVPAGGFVRMRYRFRLPRGAAGTVASLRLQPGTVPAVERAQTVPSAAVTPGAAAGSTPPAPKPDTGNAFVGNLSSYGPIYAAYGPGTDTAARIEIGFKYQLFGRAGDVGASSPRENGVFFGYRQRLFWDLGRKSSPFRNVEYMPEIFYLVPATPLSDRVTIGGQAGARHESNGRDGTASRSLNTLYIQPVATVPVGGLSLTVGPRLWAYVGSLEDNPDIRRYRGNSGLFAELGRADGWRLTTNSRINPGSGKGAVDALLSYPLDQIVDTNLNLYVFGQGFVGYGENLLDYDRRATRLRIGVGFVR
jgi:outer membrane phospholipase A